MRDFLNLSVCECGNNGRRRLFFLSRSLRPRVRSPGDEAARAFRTQFNWDYSMEDHRAELLRLLLSLLLPLRRQNLILRRLPSVCDTTKESVHIDTEIFNRKIKSRKRYQIIVYKYCEKIVQIV